MKIYFTGAVRGGRGDVEIYAQMIKILQKYGEVLTAHLGSKDLTEAGEGLPDEVLHERDIKWLKECDAVVGEITTPSLGVGYEIGRAVGWHKKILSLYRPGKRISGMILGCPDVTTVEYHDIDEAKKIIEKFFDN